MTTIAAKPASFRAPRIIFWVAFLLRVACIAIGHTYRIRVIDHHFDFGFEAGRIARSLVEGHGYGNPFNGWSGPTAWLPPLYPLLLALAFKLFGLYTRAAAFFVLTANSLFSAAIAPAVYEIAARCFDARGFARRRSTKAAPVALWSAWMWAVYPAALQYAIHWVWEMSLSTFLFTWALVLALRLRGTGEDEERAGAGQWRRWCAFGAMWGLVALSNASLLLCLPAMALWALWPRLRCFGNWRRMPQMWGGPVLAAVAFALVMSPWWIRNERTLHSFIATRSNFPAELYESTMPSHDAFPWGAAMPMWPGDPKFQLYARLGEVRYMQLRKKQSIAALRAHPKALVKHSFDRFLFFWDSTPHPTDRHPLLEYGRELSYSFLSLCGLLGLAVALRRRVGGAALMGWMFLLAPLPYYFVTVQPRFRHPIEPLIAILGVYLFRATEPRRLSAKTEA
ncbi:MAG TPA: hypothetical protein VIJ65_05600 [Acidobacteriaceae bacterium]